MCSGIKKTKTSALALTASMETVSKFVFKYSYIIVQLRVKLRGRE